MFFCNYSSNGNRFGNIFLVGLYHNQIGTVPAVFHTKNIIATTKMSSNVIQVKSFWNKIKYKPVWHFGVCVSRSLLWAMLLRYRKSYFCPILLLGESRREGNQASNSIVTVRVFTWALHCNKCYRPSRTFESGCISKRIKLSFYLSWLWNKAYIEEWKDWRKISVPFFKKREKDWIHIQHTIYSWDISHASGYLLVLREIN